MKKYFLLFVVYVANANAMYTDLRKYNVRTYRPGQVIQRCESCEEKNLNQQTESINQQTQQELQQQFNDSKSNKENKQGIKK